MAMAHFRNTMSSIILHCCNRGLVGDWNLSCHLPNHQLFKVVPFVLSQHYRNRHANLHNAMQKVVDSKQLFVGMFGGWAMAQEAGNLMHLRTNLYNGLAGF
jgi:hypothetical protein